MEEPDNPPSSPTNIYKDPDDGRQRFLLELEFVQCLANPTYIHYLAQNRYFEDEAFIGYLKYLQYWQRPEYIKFIMYPHCLFFLELLQNLNFRNAMAHPVNKELAHRQQFYFWKNYRNNRLKHILPRPLPEPTAAPPISAPVPPPPVPPTTFAAPSPVPGPGPVPSPAASALSPMQYGIPSGSALPKNDPRNSGVDRRKRKWLITAFISEQPFYVCRRSVRNSQFCMPNACRNHLLASFALRWGCKKITWWNYCCFTPL